ncbi:MAG TPA: Mov34/MPN/PAD-1 family protein [Gaiellales bacterium]|nr:Mov34/MPN/PAD-1 family protein [Gaiellales bacterium]
MTVAEVVEAGRRMLRAGTPTAPREIQRRMDAIDAVMGCLTGPQYGGDFYAKLGHEWSRLAAALPSGSSRGIVAPAMATRSNRPARSQPVVDPWYAAAEAEWQRELDRRGGDPGWNTTPVPASWRLPEPARAKIDAPSIRLDADAEPRVRVTVARSAVEAITDECLRWGDDVETGGWLAGHRVFGWHRERNVAIATVAARVRKAGKVALDEAEFTRMDAQLQAGRDRSGDLRTIGDWHTHPPDSIGQPSEADLRCQARELATIGDHNVSLTSLIVTRRDGALSWRNPQISAWITPHARSSFGERMVCEPATVNVR